MSEKFPIALFDSCEECQDVDPLRAVPHPVLERLMLIRSPDDRLLQTCRALVIFEELETVIRRTHGRQPDAAVAQLLSDLDDFRSKLPRVG